MTTLTTTCTPLNVSTFNVNGLGQDPKISAIFDKLKHGNGIIRLQQTHSTFKIDKKNIISIVTFKKNIVTTVEDFYF